MVSSLSWPINCCRHAVDMLNSCSLHTPLHGQLFSMSVSRLATSQHIYMLRCLRCGPNNVGMWQNVHSMFSASTDCLQQLFSKSVRNQKTNADRVAKQLLITCPCSGVTPLTVARVVEFDLNKLYLFNCAWLLCRKEYLLSCLADIFFLPFFSDKVLLSSLNYNNCGL